MLLPVVLLLSVSSLSAQVDARVRDGQAALEKNDLAAARKSFEEATRLQPENAGAWLLLAQVCARQKETKAALAAAQKAETIGANEPAVLQGLANFYAGIVPDYPKAAALGAQYAEKSPRDATAWHRLAVFCVSAGLPDQAIAAGARALARDDSAAIHSVLGAAYLQKRDWAKGTAELKIALDKNRFDEDAHFRLAQAYLLHQDFASAVTVLENARKTFDKSPQIELALGVALYGLRKFPEAVDQFLKTIRLAPDVPQPYIFLSRILDHATDRLPEVTQRFAEFETRNPKNYLGYLLHAKAIVAQLPPSGFPPEAQTALALIEKSVQLKEDDSEVQYQLGILLDRKQDYGEAAKHLERSAQLNPRDSAVHYALARVYARLGRKEEAAEQRALHEKLSEQENTAGPPPLSVDPAGQPGPSTKK
jgi:tetratricopeptide (TPR) repeat protein